MVDLRGALSVRTGKIEIVEMPVECRVELAQGGPVDDCLADPALYGGRGEDFKEDVKAEQRGEAGPVGKKRTEKWKVGHGSRVPDHGRSVKARGCRDAVWGYGRFWEEENKRGERDKAAFAPCGGLNSGQRGSTERRPALGAGHGGSVIHRLIRCWGRDSLVP